MEGHDMMDMFKREISTFAQMPVFKWAEERQIEIMWVANDNFMNYCKDVVFYANVEPQTQTEFLLRFPK